MKEYAADRIFLPRFYVVALENNKHCLPVGTVLAMSGSHNLQGWVTLGIVSRQTPYGQALYMGFPKNELRPATRREVLEALKNNHPKGVDFIQRRWSNFQEYRDLIPEWENIALAQEEAILVGLM